MQVQFERLSPVLVEMQIEVPADKVSAEVESAYESLKKSARVRGFRRGKAPRQVLQQLYGPAVHADVARRLMDTTLEEALREKSVQPLTQPSVESAELKPKQPFTFKARFEVRPEIAAVEWKELEAKRTAADVSDEQVGEELEQARREHATLQPVEGRAAQKGDVAQLTLRFTVDGDERTEEIETEVGEGKVLDAIDAALPGMSAGEEKEIEVAFPENHHAAQMQGKTIAIKVKLEELKERILPELDDELAKDAGHESLDAMRTSIRERLEKQAKESADEQLARALVAQLCEKNPIPLPPSLVEQQARVSEREMRFAAQLSGMPFQIDEGTRQLIVNDAEMKVRAGLLMAEIARENKLEVTPEDIEKGYQELAEQSGKNVARIKAEYREGQKRDMLIGMILEDKVLDLIEKHAKIDTTPAA